MIQTKRGVIHMKKILVSVVVLAFVLLIVGCMNYKAYNNDTSIVDDKSIQSEIANIEKQIQEMDKNEPKEVEGEVVLPKLSETKTEVAEEAFDENLEVLKVKENQFVKLKLKVSDPNQDAVNYTVSKPFNNKGEWKTKYGDAGDYIVTVTATDGKLTTERKIKVKVERVNVPPAVEFVKDITVNEGMLVKFEPLITDPNKDPITVTISEPLSQSTWQTDYKSSGEYLIRVVASDGELKTEKSFKLTVKEMNLLPVISNLKDIAAKEGQLIKLEPAVVDEDKEDKVTVTFSKPFSTDGTWTPKYTEHGVYDVNVTADDGRGGIVSKSIKVTVEAVNMAPIIDNIGIDIK